jgi:hypothetical protein
VPDPANSPLPVRRALVLGTLAAALIALLASCADSSSARPSAPTIAPARTFELTGFEPAVPARAGRPTTVAFTIRQPDGSPLTNYRRGSGPHTGVHLIFVRTDLASIIHRHPPVGPDGRIAEKVTFPEPGIYRLVVDAYPNLPGALRNFQLFRKIQVAGPFHQQQLPPFEATATDHGYRFHLAGTPHLKAIQAAFLTLTVTGPDGRPARFQPWFGALAHAIFFRAGSLDYFHTHVCAPGASSCGSVLGGASVSGSSATPGKMRVGVLLPVAGTWRLFLQCKVGGRILTAPFTLDVG